MSSEVAAEGERRGRRRQSIVRRLGVALVRAVIMLVLLVSALVLIYRFVDPPVTAVMLIKRVDGAGLSRTWVDLEDISPHLVRAVLMAEDGRFCSHRGIDMEELRKTLEAARSGERARGASTLTMQAVKNLFLWPHRSYLRKAIEVPLALYADAVWPKRRTMEIYLNIVEWDRGIYGVDAAAQHYFGVPAAALGPGQAARLAAALPDPVGRNPARPSRQHAALAKIYESRARASGDYIGCLAQ